MCQLLGWKIQEQEQIMKQSIFMQPPFQPTAVSTGLHLTGRCESYWKLQSITLENKCWFWTNYLFIAKSFSFIISLQIGSALEDRIRFKSRVSLKHLLQMKVFGKHCSNPLEHKLLNCFLWLCIDFSAPALQTGVSGIHSGYQKVIKLNPLQSYAPQMLRKILLRPFCTHLQ